jgi:DNA-binding SARP family transcriptional activator
VAHLSLSLLGGFKITLDGKPVTAFGADKVRALLAYLAMESNRPQRRATLAAIFWPELPQERAAHNLRQSLLRLRRALHEDQVRPGDRSSFLLLTGQEVQFNPLSDCQLDVTDFLELVRAYRQHKHGATDGCPVCLGWLRQAADLYRGDLLAGFTLRDSLPFDEWQLVQREALRRQALDGLSRLVDHSERQNDSDGVLEYARRLVEIDPWQERAQLQLMTALARCGQEAAALEQYVTYSQRLAQEFGAAPTAEMTELSERIRKRQLTDRVVRGTVTSQAALPDERRQVTAMLCQWQNSATSHDPEELHIGLLAFERTLAQISERYGGRQQPRHGSEFLVYFGFPVAQEDAARRAVSAALALLAATHGHDHIRLGIHTGMMVSHGHELVGNVPDRARDCLRLADGDSVTITADTERLVHGRFICQPMSLADPIGQNLIYRIHAETAELDRLVWLDQTRRPISLIGREAELQQLAACFDRVYAGQGQVITVCGEPGIGKTRLTREFRQLCPWPALWLESRCLPYFQNTSLYPIINLLEQLLGFEASDDAAVKREKLLATLACDDLAHQDTIWLLSLLLGLPTATPAPQTITEEQRERMRETCVTLLQREAARQPVMLLIEDLHWADPTTIAWLTRSLEALAAVPCVLWLNWRPEFVAPWRPRPYLLTLNLEPLDPLQACRLVNEVAGLEMLPAEVCQQIVRQADGIPLFLKN